MAYGWTLVIIALVLGGIAFIMSPQSEVAFASDDMGIVVRDGFVGADGNATIVLQNATGGVIEVNGIYLLRDFFDFDDSVVNDVSRAHISTETPLILLAGREIRLSGIKYLGLGRLDGEIEISYAMQDGIKKRARILGSGTVEPNGEVISSCTKIDSPGKFVVSSDLVHSGEAGCIEISASNVMLNCGGNSIFGSSTSNGVVGANNADWLRVSNCRISNFAYGIKLAGSSNNYVNSCQFSGNQVHGLATSNVKNSEFNSNTSNNNINAGFFLSSASGINLVNNVVSGNGRGILAEDSAKNVLTGNKLCGNSQTDLECSNSGRMVVSGSDNLIGKQPFGDCGFDIIYSDCP